MSPPNSEGRTVALTLASPAYWARAVAAAESVARRHPELEVFALRVGARESFPASEDPLFRTLAVEELATVPTPAALFRWDAAARGTAFKPFLLEWADRKLHARAALFFDADTLALDRLDPLLEPLGERPLVVAPLLAEPPRNAIVSTAGLLRRTGLVSAGCFAMRFEETTRAFLDFWRRQVERACCFDPWLGLLYDQTWFDFALCFAADVALVRDPAVHLGYWNVGGGALRRTDSGWRFDGRPVRLLHATGFDPRRPERISRHLAREDEPSVAAIAPLLAEYGAIVRGVEERLGADELADPEPRFRGTDLPVPDAVRRLVAAVDPTGERWPDPFDPAGPGSCLEWLLEPLAFSRGTLHRAALALWESRTDLVDAFPDPCGRDLEAFVAWLRGPTGAASCGFSSRWIEDVHSEPAPADAALAEVPDLPVGWSRWRDPAMALARTRERYPGSATAVWLDEPVGVAREGEPPLPRWAHLLHRSRPDLQRRFPDPAGADQAAFRAWLTAAGLSLS